MSKEKEEQIKYLKRKCAILEKGFRAAVEQLYDTIEPMDISINRFDKVKKTLKFLESEKDNEHKNKIS